MPPNSLDSFLRTSRIATLVLGAALLVWLGVHLGLLTEDRWLPELLCLGLIAGAALGWSTGGVSPRRRRIATALLALIILPAITVQAHGRLQEWGTDAQVAEWGVFHYYLGSKYFDELQYTELYREAYIADWDGGTGPRAFAAVKKVRDLRTYRSLKTEQLRQEARSARWSDARWAEFKADVAWLGRQAQGKRWRAILHDRGYNPPPSYTLISGFWTGLLSLRDPLGQTLLINLDMLLLLGALLFSVRAYGWSRSLLVLGSFILWYGNANRVYGQIWILDWFAACWAACSAWRLKRHGLSGALLGYAACMRVFPAVLLLGPPLVWAVRRLRRKGADTRRLLRFALAAAAVTLLLVAGSTLRYGPAAWESWATNISAHNDDHKGGKRRFGLEHIFVLDFSAGLKQQPKKLSVRRNLKANQSLYRTLSALLVILALAAMARSNAHDAMLLGVVFFFGLMVASRYYGALTVLVLLLGLGADPARAGPEEGDPESPAAPGSTRPAWLLTADIAMIFVLWTVYSGRFAGPQVQYIWSNLSWLCWWIVLLGWIAFTPRRRAGQKAAC
jgi:hypothetical protein